jgi:glucosylceramidase
MKSLLKTFSFTVALLFVSVLINAQKKNTADWWLTNPDKSVLFEQQKQQPLKFAKAENNNPTIIVDEKQTYQTIDGFGFALTGGSAQHIIRMSAESRAALLKELFATDNNNIGISYLRLSIGASDLNDHVFSYDDLPAGEVDTALIKFDLGPDKQDVIPVMKEILAINPKIKILASPWSPPTWMKTNNDTRGGSLKPEFYTVYAKYFVKYIQAMKAEGIIIDAITVQNEPLHPGNNPSLLLLANEEGNFIKTALGPAFEAAGINTKIVLYDHNADKPEYPVSIMNDPEAKKYVAGSGFHLYGGKIEALTDVHNAHPDKNIYFTEQMTVDRKNATNINIARPISQLIVGATRNWSVNVIEWNLAADADFKPYTDRGGCSMCEGAVTIEKNNVKRNVAYYSIAHASKFVRPGSVRIASNDLPTLTNVAFKTPSGKKVLIVANKGEGTQTFNISYDGKIITSSLNKGSVATYVW